MRGCFLKIFLGLTCCFSSVHAAPITESFDFMGLGLVIPDGNPSGLAHTPNINTTIDTIQSVRVAL